MRALISVIAAALVVLPVHAQQAPLPREAQTAIDEARKDCGATAALKKGFVATRDVNGDGKPDVVLNYGKFECDGFATFFCGSAGCLAQVFASLPDGTYVKAWDENVRAMRFATVKGKPALIVDLHGSACNKAGAAPCTKTLLWNGKTFAGR